MSTTYDTCIKTRITNQKVENLITNQFLELHKWQRWNGMVIDHTLKQSDEKAYKSGAPRYIKLTNERQGFLNFHDLWSLRDHLELISCHFATKNLA